MAIFRKIVLLLVASSIGNVDLTYGKEIAILNETGKEEYIDIGLTESFFSVLEWIGSYLEKSQDIDPQGYLETEGTPNDLLSAQYSNSKEFIVDLSVNRGEVTIKSFKNNGNGTWRNYNAPVDPEDKKDIRFIITTLAQNSLPSIANSRSSLKRAGNRIHHLHPLKFLAIVFLEEELKVGMHAIRDRGWIWDDFLDGLIKSLREETARQNMTLEIIQDFATNVGVRASKITVPIQDNRWKDFINMLIDDIPRANNPNRYNM